MEKNRIQLNEAGGLFAVVFNKTWLHKNVLNTFYTLNTMNY